MQKVFNFSNGVILFGIALSIGCTSTNIKGREVWAERQESISDIIPAYKLLSKVSGQGCVTEDIFGVIRADSPTYYEGIKRKDAFSHASSIAAFLALQKEPNADLFVQTSVNLEKTGDRYCSEVRGLAVQITEIYGIRKNSDSENSGKTGKD